MKKEDFLKMGLILQPDGTYRAKTLAEAKAERVIPGYLDVKIPNNSPDFTSHPVIEWFIPYQVPSKKNCRVIFVNKVTGKMMNIPSAAYREYIAVTKMYWEAFGYEFRDALAKMALKWPINIELTFIRKTNQVVDYFGPGESVFDIMTDFNWWPDDSIRYGKPFFGDMIVDKNNPGVRIKILM